MRPCRSVPSEDAEGSQSSSESKEDELKDGAELVALTSSSDHESDSDVSDQGRTAGQMKRRKVATGNAKALQPSRRQPGRQGSAAEKNLKEDGSSARHVSILFVFSQISC